MESGRRLNPGGPEESAPFEKLLEPHFNATGGVGVGSMEIDRGIADEKVADSRDGRDPWRGRGRWSFRAGRTTAPGRQRSPFFGRRVGRHRPSKTERQSAASRVNRIRRQANDHPAEQPSCSGQASQQREVDRHEAEDGICGTLNPGDVKSKNRLPQCPWASDAASGRCAGLSRCGGGIDRGGPAKVSRVGYSKWRRRARLERSVVVRQRAGGHNEGALPPPQIWMAPPPHVH